jgi:hypothetical protein
VFCILGESKDQDQDDEEGGDEQEEGKSEGREGKREGRGGRRGGGFRGGRFRGGGYFRRRGGRGGGPRSESQSEGGKVSYNFLGFVMIIYDFRNIGSKSYRDCFCID